MADYYGILMKVGIEDIRLDTSAIEQILKVSGVKYHSIYRHEDLIVIQIIRQVCMTPENIDYYLKEVLGSCGGFRLKSLKVTEVFHGG
jgi:hypothetical protein